MFDCLCSIAVVPRLPWRDSACICCGRKNGAEIKTENWASNGGCMELPTGKEPRQSRAGSDKWLAAFPWKYGQVCPIARDSECTGGILFILSGLQAPLGTPKTSWGMWKTMSVGPLLNPEQLTPTKWLSCCVSIVLFTTTISKISPLFLLQKDILIHHFLWPGDQEHLSTSQSINNIIFMPKIVPLFSCITHLDKGAYNSSSRTNIRIVITEWLGGSNRIRPTSIVDDEWQRESQTKAGRIRRECHRRTITRGL